ncbi:MAG TPA: lanthionine synthetase LanC family protein [Pseudonocardiaceae bacterium]|nr:lanthionine synthetase LanC family protein [Pseudonocardiaceae bacterium]
MSDSEMYREVAEAAWGWVLGQIHDEDGPWLPETAGSPTPAGDRDSLYAGIAGLAPVLVEIGRYRELTGERALVDGIVDRLTHQAAVRVEPSLYDGLAGDVTALRLLAPGRERAAMHRLAELATPDGWATTQGPSGSTAPLTDIVVGTAGVVHAAAWAGGDAAAKIMTIGGEALLRVAEPTEAGLDWRMWPGYPSSMPNFSHGTAGVAAALAVAGHAVERSDFVDAARQGAEHVLSAGSLDDDGFVVPHTFPPSTREVEPVTYGWCHGAAGTSLLFAALARAGVDRVGGTDAGELRMRCLRSILAAGVPRRLRPGFWDNDGRCCGTAGVGDLLLDAAQDTPEQADWLTAGARTMADAVVERAIRDGTEVYWRFVEHRREPPLLPPNTSWMQGAAGIVAFLFRFARVLEEGPAAMVVDRPDQWWAVPAGLRVSDTEHGPPG